MNNLEYKSIEFECKSTAAKTGGLTGLGNSLYTVDKYGDVATEYKMLPELIKDGFLTDTHGLPEGQMGDYTYKGQIGIINDAKADDKGLYVDVSFHPDEDSQKIRAKVENRIDNHKGVFFSIGWKPAEQPIILTTGVNFKSQLAKHVPADKINQIVEQAKDLPRIRLIKAEVREIALAPRPVDPRAAVDGYKNMNKITFKDTQFKAEYLGKEVEDSLALSAIDSLYNRLRSAMCDSCYPVSWLGEDAETEDERVESDEVLGAIDEFCEIAKAVFTKMQELEEENGNAGIPEDEVEIAKALRQPIEFKAVWTQKYQDSLPDSSFAYIEPGGEKKDGKTEPKSKRHFPYKDKNGKPDAAHVRNALARIPQSKVSAAAKESALRKIKAAAKRLGIGKDSEEKSFFTVAEGFKAGAKHSKETMQNYKDVMDSCKDMLDALDEKMKAEKEHHKNMKDEISSVYDCMKDMSDYDGEQPEDDDTEEKAFLDSVEAQLLESEYQLLLQ